MLDFYFFNKFILFIYFWLHWVFTAAHGLSLVVANQGYSLLQCANFSLWWLLLLQITGSRCAAFSSCDSRALERRLSSCGARAQLLRGMWDLPRPGLKPVSSALAGRFLTTVPPGKSQVYIYKLSGEKDLNIGQYNKAYIIKPGVISTSLYVNS